MVWCIFQGGDQSYPTYLPPTPAPFVPVAGRSELGAVSPTSNAGAFVELHPNLRCTVTTGPSGVAEVMILIQGGYMTVTATDDFSIATNVDGGGWILCGGFPFNAINVIQNFVGHHVHTGLTPGSHTFGVGWASTGGGTLNLPGLARGPCQHSANIVLPR
jgi:hypothetical protein